MSVRFLSGINVDSNTLFVDDANDRVGIGIGIPDHKLHVVSSEQCPALFESTTSGGGIALMDSTTTNDAQVGIGAFGNDLCFRSGGSAAGNMRLLANGNLGIGTTNPNQKLEIAEAAEQGTTPPTIRITNTTTNYGSTATIGVSHGTIEFYQQESSGNYPAVSAAIMSINEDNYAIEHGLGFFTNNNALTPSEQMRITSTGNVGIGTTEPDAKLHLSSGTSGDCLLIIEADTDNNDENDTPQIWLKADGGLNQGLIGLNDNTLDLVNNVASGGGIRFLTGVTNNSGTTTPYTGASEHVRITSDGNVGIGTDNPDIKLDVRGTTPTVLRVSRSGTAGSTGGACILFEAREPVLGTGQTARIDSAVGFLSFRTGGVSGDTDGGEERLRITAAGNVGIGADNPASTRFTNADNVIVDVKGKAINRGGVITLRTSDDSKEAFLANDAGLLQIGMYTNNDVAFYTNNAEAMRITAAGNVGIGTDSPDALLEISGNAGADPGPITNPITFRITDAGTAATGAGDTDNPWGRIQFYSEDQSSGGPSVQAQIASIYGNIYSSSSHLAFYTQAVPTTGIVERMRIRDSGGVSIGTSSATGLFNVQGTSYFADDIILRDGSVSSGDTLVRIYDSSDDGVIDVYQNNSVTARINGNGASYFNGGNVGIGTTAPGFKLQVGTPAVLSGSDYAWSFDLTRANDTTRGFSIGQADGGGTVVLGSHNADMAFGHTFGVDANGLPVFYETMRIQHVDQAVGNVGIGTNNPNARLDVQGGDILAGADIHLDNIGSYVTFYGDNSGQHAITSRNTAGSADDDIRINSYGNVLINIDSNNNNNQNAAFLVGRHGGANGAMSDTGLFIVREDSTVGINTTNPTATLDVNGQFRIAGGSFSSLGTATGNGTYTNQWQKFLTITRINFSSAAFKIRISGHGNTAAQSLVADVEFNFKNQNAAIRWRATVNSYGTTPISVDDIEIYNDNTNGVFNFYYKPTENYTQPQYSIVGGIVVGYTWQNTVIGASLSGETNDAVTSGLKFQGITQDGDSGNVGIGTTSPGSLLDVTGPAGVSGSNLFKIQKDGGFGSTDFYQYYNSSSDYGINIGLAVSSSVNGRAGIIIRSTTGGNGTLVFNTTSTERMRITSAGNVGIGTTGPTYGLVVANQSTANSATGTMYIGAALNGSGKGLVIDSATRTIDDNAVLALEIINRAGGNTMAATVAGNVGIGTDNPTTKLYVDGGESTFNRGNSDGAIARFRGKNAEQAVIGTVDSWFDSNVGIGTTNPGAALNVKGHAQIDQYDAGTTVPSTAGYLRLMSSSKTGWAPGDELGKIEFYSVDTSGIGARNVSSIRAINSQGNGTSTTTSNGELAFYTSALNATESEAVRIDSAGNVGIGVTNPLAMLDIDGNSTATNLILRSRTGSDFANLTFTDDTGATSLSAIGNASGDLRFLVGSGLPERMRITDAGEAYFANDIYLRDGATTSGDILVRIYDSSDDGVIDVYRNNSVVNRIHGNGNSYFNAGNVGIGTTAPGTKLTIRTESASHQIFSINRAATNVAALYLGNDASTHAIIAANNSDLRLGKDLSDTFYEYVRIKDGGNVGIGTTAPVNKLQVTSASNDVEVLRVDNTAGNSGSVQGVTHLGLNFFGVGNNSGARITAYQNGTSGYTGGMYFSTRGVNSDSAPTEAMRITHDQLIGLGPVASFTTTHRVWIDKGSSTYAVYSQGSIQVNAGAIGVGVTPSATSGRIDAANDIVAYSTSDQRLKENITPIANALDKVKALTGVEFDWKEETKDVHGYEGHDVGVIAQEVQAVLPEAVRTNDSGYLSVRYEKMIALLVEANKELASRVEELEKKLK